MIDYQLLDSGSWALARLSTPVSAVAAQAATLGPESPLMARTALMHASVLAKIGRKSEARQVETSARAILAREQRQILKVSIDELRGEPAK